MSRRCWEITEPFCTSEPNNLWQTHYTVLSRLHSCKYKCNILRNRVYCWDCQRMHKHTLHCRGSSFSLHEHTAAHIADILWDWPQHVISHFWAKWTRSVCLSLHVHTHTIAPTHRGTSTHKYTDTQTYTAHTLSVCHDSCTPVLKNPASQTKTPTGQQLFLLDPSWGRKRKKRKRA